MTKWQQIKCAIGIHGSKENIGAGRGGTIIQGRQFETECRLWRCSRCGKEVGVVTCPSVSGWGMVNVPPEFIRRTSGYSDFDKAGIAESED